MNIRVVPICLYYKQISQILLEFTYFIFTTINIFYQYGRNIYHKTHKFYQNQQKSYGGT